MAFTCRNILKQEQNEAKAAQQVSSQMSSHVDLLADSGLEETQLCTNVTISVFSQVQAKAQAMATALQTIGKFTVKKKSGAADSIFGRYCLML